MSTKNVVVSIFDKSRSPVRVFATKCMFSQKLFLGLSPLPTPSPILTSKVDETESAQWIQKLVTLLRCKFSIGKTVSPGRPRLSCPCSDSAAVRRWSRWPAPGRRTRPASGECVVAGRGSLSLALASLIFKKLRVSWIRKQLSRDCSLVEIFF